MMNPKPFWPCYLCGKEVWTHVGKVVKVGRKRFIAHNSCVKKESQ